MEEIPNSKIWTIDNISTYHHTLDEKLLWRAVSIRTQGFKTDNINKSILDDLDSEFEEIRPDYVINLAAYPSVKLVDQYPTEALEVMGAGQLNLLYLCQKYKVKNYIYFSSSMVYGNWTRPVVSEKFKTKPINLYGQYKLFAELLCRNFDVTTTIIRPSAVYGPGDYSHRVLNQFCLNALRDEPLRVNDPKSLIDFTHVKDVARAVTLILKRNGNVWGILNNPSPWNYNPWVINVSGGRGISLAHAVTVLESITNKKLNVIVKPRDKNQPRRGTLNVTKATFFPGWTPNIKFELGLQDLYGWIHKFYQH
jgi:nucleoside-diphosphate-sugar epimerase